MPPIGERKIASKLIMFHLCLLILKIHNKVRVKYSWFEGQVKVQVSAIFCGILTHGRKCISVCYWWLCINLCCTLAGHSTSSLSTVQPKDPPEPTDKRDPYIAVPSLTQHESTGKPWNGNGRLHFCYFRNLLQFHAASSRPAHKARDALILVINYCAPGRERIIKQRP